MGTSLIYSQTFGRSCFIFKYLKRVFHVPSLCVAFYKEFRKTGSSWLARDFRPPLQDKKVLLFLILEGVCYHQREAYGIVYHHSSLFGCTEFYFSHSRSAQIKKLILGNLLRTPINQGVDTFPDPVGNVWAPWRPFWILQVVRRCRRCGISGGEQGPPSPLVWY